MSSYLHNCQKKHQELDSSPNIHRIQLTKLSPYSHKYQKKHQGLHLLQLTKLSSCPHGWRKNQQDPITIKTRQITWLPRAQKYTKTFLSQLAITMTRMLKVIVVPDWICNIVMIGLARLGTGFFTLQLSYILPIHRQPFTASTFKTHTQSFTANTTPYKFSTLPHLPFFYILRNHLPHSSSTLTFQGQTSIIYRYQIDIYIHIHRAYISALAITVASKKPRKPSDHNHAVLRFVANGNVGTFQHSFAFQKCFN